MSTANSLRAAKYSIQYARAGAHEMRGWNRDLPGGRNGRFGDATE